jgi:hypothetical protein
MPSVIAVVLDSRLYLMLLHTYSRSRLASGG